MTSSVTFAKHIKVIEAAKIIAGLNVPDNQREFRFNEKMLRVLCLNQVIEKFQKELSNLYSARDKILNSFEEQKISEKLGEFINKIRF